MCKVNSCKNRLSGIIYFTSEKYYKLKNTEKLSSDTIKYAKEKLETYDNYQANDETKSLVRLLDKTTELAKNMNSHQYTDAELNTYACEQHLTGIIVLDNDLNAVMQTTTDGDTYLKWKDILQDDSVKEIIECPKKSYMTNMENCDIAVVSRLDSAGVIMSYVVQNSINERVNDISLEDIFSGMTLQQKGVLFITDENGKVASNTEDISENTIDNFDSIWKKSVLVRGKRMKKINFDNIGLVDLHLHLDGSLSLNSVKALMQLQKIKNYYNDDELLSKLQISEGCRNLNEYLEKFDFPLTLLQTTEALELAVYNLLEELKMQGIIYAEIRFAPQLHTNKGLSQEQIVTAIIDGMKKSELDANLILCCMRGLDNHAENIETVRVAEKFLKKGVVAIDLAGAEGIFQTRNFRDIFEMASEKDIPFTIHAGEADDFTSVEDAVSFGAARIGHGVRSVENERVMQRLKDKKIALELCPTSNLNTNIYDDISQYPIKKFIDAGIIVTINTDNMTVSNTNLKKELNILVEAFGFDENDIIDFERNAIKYSFADKELKKKLIRRIDYNSSIE